MISPIFIQPNFSITLPALLRNASISFSVWLADAYPMLPEFVFS